MSAYQAATHPCTKSNTHASNREVSTAPSIRIPRMHAPNKSAPASTHPRIARRRQGRQWSVYLQRGVAQQIVQRPVLHQLCCSTPRSVSAHQGHRRAVLSLSLSLSFVSCLFVAVLCRRLRSLISPSLVPVPVPVSISISVRLTHDEQRLAPSLYDRAHHRRDARVPEPRNDGHLVQEILCHGQPRRQLSAERRVGDRPRQRAHNPTETCISKWV
eukprot:2225437-Rhodomonas_salina.9